MRIALLGEFPSQPIQNTAESIKRHSKHKIELYDRFANLSHIDADVIYYMNILDLLLHREAYSQMVSFTYHGRSNICSTIRSYRILQDETIQVFLKEMTKYISILSFNNNETMELVSFDGNKMRIKEAPDETMFCQSNDVDVKGKLRLGYVGTFREDKRFIAVLEPVMKKYEQIAEFFIVGKAGNKIPFAGMKEFYNSIHALLLPSIYEGAPLPPMEAALCGRMTIGTKCGDMEEIFTDSSATLIGVSENTASTQAAFEDAILDLHSHRNDAVVKGRNAKMAIQQNRHWDDVIKDYDKMFEECSNG